MGIGPETSPRNVGSFLVWLGVALLAALLLFLVIFYFHGHKAGLMKNSSISLPIPAISSAMPHPLMASS